MVGVVALLVFAFALGQVSRALEMGPYVVGLIGEDVPTFWLPALVFLVGCFVSFTLGSSWTTFAILIPIALPLAQGLDISMPLMLGAVLSVYSSKTAVVAAYSRRIDDEVLKSDDPELIGEPPRDRLFDVMMRLTMAIIKTAPIGVLGFMLFASAGEGLEVFRALA